MSRGRRRLAPLMAAAALFAASCTALPTDPDDLTDYLDQTVGWQDCPADEFLDSYPAAAQCATVEVPVDYADPGSGRGSLEIALIRVPATEQPAAGHLLINPGGPGGSGVEHVALSAKDLQRSLPGYDIVGFDPRGVARSAGFDCGTSTAERRAIIELDFTPEDQAEFDTNFALNSEYEAACREANPDWAYFGTWSVARDVALISTILGDPGINYFGISYGSAIGYELLRSFGDRVDRMILESPVDPTAEEVLADQLAAFNTKIEDLLVLCASPEYSYCGAGRTAEQVRADFLAALTDIENPDFGTLTGNGAPSEALVYYGLALPLYFEWSDEWTKRYLDAVYGLLNNDTASTFERWGYLYQGYDPIGREFFTTDDIQQLVRCLDESEPASQIDIAAERAADAAELARIEQEAPLLHAVGFSGAYLDDDRAYQPCSYAEAALADPGLPDPPPAAEPITNPSAAAVLVLGVSGDTATPYPWAQAAAAALDVPLVTQDTSGHGVYTSSGNACTEAVVGDYLATGTPPDSELTC